MVTEKHDFYFYFSIFSRGDAEAYEKMEATSKQ